MRTPKNQSSFAKKNLGQNFLNSLFIRDQIIAAAGDVAGKKILEVGPGLGFLTEALLDADTQLTAIDLDDRVIPILKKKFAPQKESGQFDLYHGSILDFDLDGVFGADAYSCIANIPYHITGPILRKLLAETINKPEFSLLMVQKEVAQKICPKDHPKKGIKRSILSLSVEVFAEAEICFLVDRKYFDPSPKVDSAIIKITKRPAALISKEYESAFFTIVNAGFHERRKKLKNSFQSFFGHRMDDLMEGLDPALRAENLDISDWVRMAKVFADSKN
jgi:16S rRNA (adenine1518-N6/adenine1519-N6)-dimethyltransferase